MCTNDSVRYHASPLYGPVSTAAMSVMHNSQSPHLPSLTHKTCTFLHSRCPTAAGMRWVQGVGFVLDRTANCCALSYGPSASASLFSWHVTLGVLMGPIVCGAHG